MQVAVVGLGYWGPNLVRNLHSVGSCTSIVVFDTDAERVNRILRQYPTTRAGGSYEELLEDRDVEAVALATPILTHYELARRALEAGKHVMVEKPLATSSEEAQALLTLARERGQVLMAGHTFLYSPPVQLVNELVRSGQIGEPLYVLSSRMNLGGYQSELSVTWDLAAHDLSILFAWLEEFPVRVSSIGRATQGMQSADVAFINLEFPSGCIGSLHLSWVAPTKVRRVTLVGSRRMVVYEDTNPEEPVKVYDKGMELVDPQDFGQHQLTYRSGDVVSPRVEAREPLHAELEDFLGRVARGEVPDAREDTAVRVVRVIEAAEHSRHDGGIPVEL